MFGFFNGAYQSTIELALEKAYESSNYIGPSLGNSVDNKKMCTVVEYIDKINFNEEAYMIYLSGENIFNVAGFEYNSFRKKWIQIPMWSVQ